MGKKMSRVAGGIAQGGRIEINEIHLAAVQEDMVGLQVAMDGRRWNLFQAADDRGANCVDLGPQLVTSPGDEHCRLIHVIELVNEVMMEVDGKRALTPDPSPSGWERGTLVESGDGPRDCADRSVGLTALNQKLLKRRARGLLQHQGAQLGQVGNGPNHRVCVAFGARAFWSAAASEARRRYRCTWAYQVGRVNGCIAGGESGVALRLPPQSKGLEQFESFLAVVVAI